MTNQDYGELERDALERFVLQKVCAFMYYDLADCINETTDAELEKIIKDDYPCSCEECLTRQSEKS